MSDPDNTGSGAPNEPGIPTPVDEEPPSSNPPTLRDPPEREPRVINPTEAIVSGVLEALKPFQESVGTAITSLQRRAEEQQKLIENIDKVVEDRVARAIAVVYKDQQQPSSAEYVPPGKAPFQGQGGIMGMIGDIIKYAMSPNGTQMIQNFTGNSQMKLFNDFYSSFHEAADRSLVRQLSKTTGIFPLDFRNEVVAEHTIEGDHVQ